MIQDTFHDGMRVYFYMEVEKAPKFPAILSAITELLSGRAQLTSSAENYGTWSMNDRFAWINEVSVFFNKDKMEARLNLDFHLRSRPPGKSSEYLGEAWQMDLAAGLFPVVRAHVAWFGHATFDGDMEFASTQTLGINSGFKPLLLDSKRAKLFNDINREYQLPPIWKSTPLENGGLRLDSPGWFGMDGALVEDWTIPRPWTVETPLCDDSVFFDPNYFSILGYGAAKEYGEWSAMLANFMEATQNYNTRPAEQIGNLPLATHAAVVYNQYKGSNPGIRSAYGRMYREYSRMKLDELALPENYMRFALYHTGNIALDSSLGQLQLRIMEPADSHMPVLGMAIHVGAQADEYRGRSEHLEIIEALFRAFDLRECYGSMGPPFHGELPDWRIKDIIVEIPLEEFPLFIKRNTGSEIDVQRRNGWFTD